MITALDLTSGTVMWNRPRLGQPLAANISRLVTVDSVDNGVALRLINAETGQECQRLALDLPSWAQSVIGEADAASFHAIIEGNNVRVFWWLRRPHRGGPPLGPAIPNSPDEPVEGSILLDPASGTVFEKGPWIMPADQPEPIPSSDPTVLSQQRIGDRIYCLRATPGPGRRATITVEARSTATGQVEWETPVSVVEDAGAPALRS